MEMGSDNEWTVNLSQNTYKMELLPINEINVEHSKLREVEQIMKATFRLITFSREHFADDLLNTYLSSSTDLQQLLSIKNAQMEAQNEQEAQDYLVTLNQTMLFVTSEIENQVDFNKELQLFQLFRSISPDSHANHPNRYRDKLVQIGSYLCPEPEKIPSLVSELFYNMNSIKNPIIRAIYFHHELIRIHPFIDGNGRTTRIAKNWILMYNLYPPIFIRDENEKSSYINTLSKSFNLLEKAPTKWNNELFLFFNQEIERLRFNSLLVYDAVHELGKKRKRNGYAIPSESVVPLIKSLTKDAMYVPTTKNRMAISKLGNQKNETNHFAKNRDYLQDRKIHRSTLYNSASKESALP